jgi:hypothetical protein
MKFVENKSNDFILSPIDSRLFRDNSFSIISSISDDICQVHLHSKEKKVVLSVRVKAKQREISFVHTCAKSCEISARYRDTKKLLIR